MRLIPVQSLDFFSQGGPKRLLAVFVLIVTAVVVALSTDFRPQPIFNVLRSNGVLTCTATKPIVMVIKLPVRPVESFEFQMVVQPGAPLTVTAWNANTKEKLVSASCAQSGHARVPIPPHTADGLKALMLSFQSSEADEARAPKITASWDKPNWPAMVAPPHEAMPLLRFHFRWPSLWLLWAWVLVPIAGWVAWHRRQTAGIYLTLLALCCAITSIFVWQREYSAYYGHWDADDYGYCASSLADYLTHPEKREAVALFMRKYSHSSNVLSSAIMAVPIALGAPEKLVYPIFSSLCGFAALLLFASILHRFLKLRFEVWLVANTLFAIHWIHVRSFSRPITDEFGLLVVMVMLYLMFKRLHGMSPFETAACSAMVLIAPLSRPPGLAYVPFFLAAIVGCDAWREKQWALRRRFITVTRLAVIPLAILAAMFVTFGWFHNCHDQLTANVGFNTVHEWIWFAPIMGVVQWLPLIAICAQSEVWKRPAVIALCTWGGWYVIMLVLVRAAPMCSRYQLPLLPVYVALAACALEMPRPFLRLIAWGLTVLACAANLAAMIYQILVLDVPNSIISLITSW